MKDLPSAWVEAGTSLVALAVTFNEYAVARIAWNRKFTEAEPELYANYTRTKILFLDAHKAWKTVMSKMIQGRQL